MKRHSKQLVGYIMVSGLLALTACGGGSVPQLQSASQQESAAQEPSDAVVNGGNKVYTAQDFRAVVNTPFSKATASAAQGTDCQQYTEEQSDICDQAASSDFTSMADMSKWTSKLNALCQVLSSCLESAQPGTQQPALPDYQVGSNPAANNPAATPAATPSVSPTPTPTPTSAE